MILKEESLDLFENNNLLETGQLLGKQLIWQKPLEFREGTNFLESG